MGYRSNWKLAAKGSAENLRALKSWVENTAKLMPCKPGDWESRAGWFEYFRGLFAPIRIQVKDTLLVIGSDNLKCYGAFDKTVQEILAYGRDELKLDMAYASLGDDDDDVSRDDGNDIYIPINRSLGDVE